MRLNSLIDAHIHLDQYDEATRNRVISQAHENGIGALISVSMNLKSCITNLELSRTYPGMVIPTFGYHPEQPVPSAEDLKSLLDWIEGHVPFMAAVGEIGLPYYTRKEAEERGKTFDLEPYIDLLDLFLGLAARYGKPAILHAVYEDAAIVCDLLENHGVTRAHFHWFKGPAHTVRRMAECGYYISFTPDLLYEPEIIDLAKYYPVDLVMAETDGPWPFEGPYEGQPTEPGMVRDVTAAWAELHRIPFEQACEIITSNTKRFYGL